jgi:4-hydroxybenzoate polyprenyltransferase
VNQIVDIESDRINHKLFLLPHGFISVPAAWTLAVLCAVSGIVISFIYDPAVIVLFFAGLLIGVMYNLPPFTLKNRALGGVLANALVMVAYFLLAGILQNMDLRVPADIRVGLISSISPALANGQYFWLRLFRMPQGIV